MIDEPTEDAAADEAAPSPDNAYAWVRNGSIADVAGRHRAIREGDTGEDEQAQPATAIRVLHEFALQRKTDHLVACVEHFDSADAVTVLSVAALSRPIEEAADLAIKVWRAEATGDATPRTDRIVYELASQRIALEVAEFVRACRAGDPELATKTLNVFVRRRTNRDKALLYFVLRDEGCPAEAAELLRLSLVTLADDASAPPHETDPAEFHDLVGALYQLSPSERVLEKWISEELRSSHQLKPTKALVVRLVINQTGPNNLVEFLGERLSYEVVVPVCADLYAQSAEWCAAVRSHIGLRTDIVALTALVHDWQQSKTLRRTTRDLLVDIVTHAGATTPEPRLRSLAELEELDERLRYRGDVGAECARLLWTVAAAHIGRRAGAELVAVLRNIEPQHDRQRAARLIGQRLAVAVHNGETCAMRRTIDYLVGLRADHDSAAVYSARRELGDPSRSDQVVAPNPPVIAEIAVALYRAGLAKDGWDLLERCLENEQALHPQDVLSVVQRLHDSQVLEQDQLLFLLRATVGRWSDAHHRDEAEKLLRARGYTMEATQIILSLR